VCLTLIVILSTSEENTTSLWSTCSLTCGAGIQWQMRNGERSWRACGLYPCPSNHLSWRDKLCSQQKDSLNAKASLSHFWESSANSDSSCLLECKPVGQSLPVYRLNHSLVDGAICGRGKLNICLMGYCEVNKIIKKCRTIRSLRKLVVILRLVPWLSLTNVGCVEEMDLPAG
jgi:hypothetical protein